MTIELMKNVISENRPQFLDTCRPDSAVNCTVGEFISSYNCTNTEYSRILVRESNHSFPSGHAALSFFVALFMVRYLQYRCKEVRNQYLLKLLYLLLVAVAVFCSFSRVYDRRHFWWDVAAGILLGVFFTFYTVRKIIQIKI
jgi:membrane-associated phospholipid phosphatase